MRQNDEIPTLIGRFLLNKLTSEEKKDLEEWIRVSNDNKLNFKRLTNLCKLSEQISIYFRHEEPTPISTPCRKNGVVKTISVHPVKKRRAMAMSMS